MHTSGVLSPPHNLQFEAAVHKVQAVGAAAVGLAEYPSKQAVHAPSVFAKVLQLATGVKVRHVLSAALWYLDAVKHVEHNAALSPSQVLQNLVESQECTVKSVLTP